MSACFKDYNFGITEFVLWVNIVIVNSVFVSILSLLLLVLWSLLLLLFAIVLLLLLVSLY